MAKAKPKRKRGKAGKFVKTGGKTLTTNSSYSGNDVDRSGEEGQRTPLPADSPRMGGEPRPFPYWLICLWGLGAFLAGATLQGMWLLAVSGAIVGAFSVLTGLAITAVYAGSRAERAIIRTLTSREPEHIYTRRVVSYALLRELDWMMSENAPEHARRITWSIADKFSKRVMAQIYGMEGKVMQEAGRQFRPEDEESMIETIDQVFPKDNPKQAPWNRISKGLMRFAGRKPRRALPGYEDDSGSVYLER